jgi:hypothetical protein
VCDANGQSLAYVYSRENPNDARIAKVLTCAGAATKSPHGEVPKERILARDCRICPIGFRSPSTTGQIRRE